MHVIFGDDVLDDLGGELIFDVLVQVLRTTSEGRLGRTCLGSGFGRREHDLVDSLHVPLGLLVHPKAIKIANCKFTLRRGQNSIGVVNGIVIRLPSSDDL